MRRESTRRYLAGPSAPVWGAQKEFGYGEGPILDRSPKRTCETLYSSDDELAHYGIPGMKWGVRAKEYVAKGYNTMARRLAIKKMQRKAAAKEEARRQFEEGYQRGKKVVANSYFIKRRVDDTLRQKREQEEGSASDRAVDKATDWALKKTGLDKMAKNYGLDAYIPMAKNFLKSKKDELVDNIIDGLQTEEGQQRLQKVANFLGRGVSASISVGTGIASAAKSGGRIAAKAARSGLKAAARFAGESTKSGYRRLREGDPNGAQKIHERMRMAEQLLSKYGNIAADILSESMKQLHKGAHGAHNNLNTLLAKRYRRG